MTIHSFCCWSISPGRLFTISKKYCWFIILNYCILVKNHWCIYIYAFIRCFYPKRLKLYIFCMCSLGIEPTTFALLTQCSNHWATGTHHWCITSTEPHSVYKIETLVQCKITVSWVFSLECHMILKKSFRYADLLLKNICYYYQCCFPVNIFVV